MTDAPEILLAHHLKTLKLPTFLRETRSWLANAQPKGSTMSASSPAWLSWNSSTASGG